MANKKTWRFRRSKRPKERIDRFDACLLKLMSVEKELADILQKMFAIAVQDSVRTGIRPRQKHVPNDVYADICDFVNDYFETTLNGACPLG